MLRGNCGEYFCNAQSIRNCDKGCKGMSRCSLANRDSSVEVLCIDIAILYQYSGQ
jgi:hypothetical protein